MSSCCCQYYPPEPNLWLHAFALCSPYVCFMVCAFCCAPPAKLLDAGTREGPKQLLQQCRRRRRCHLVCVFPHSFSTNIERHGGDVPAQAARRTRSVKMLFPGLSKNEVWHPWFFLRFLSTTLIRELRFSGQHTTPLWLMSAVLLSVLSARTKHLVACVCFVFPLRLLYYLGILLCTPRNTSGCRDEGRPKTVAATIPPPPPLSPRVFVS